MKLLRKSRPDPRQLALELDFFAPVAQGRIEDPIEIDSPAQAPVPIPESATQHTLPTLPTLPSGQPMQPPAPGMRRIQLGDQVLDFGLTRSKRRTIGFVVDDDGLRIIAPKWVTLSEIDSAIRDKQRWILSKMHDRRERSARRLQPQMTWRDGGMLPYLGENITLRIARGRNDGAFYNPHTRELTISLPADAGEQQLKDRVQSWLQLEAKRIFAERLPVYAEKLKVKFHSFKLSSAQTQWGSCTADGKIRLNWRLVHFAMAQIDYVIAHELSHLREMNHSPRFWATVQSIFPEFEAARRALRDLAPETLPAF